VDAKLVYLANPDNPMGSWHDAATLCAGDRRSARGHLLPGRGLCRLRARRAPRCPCQSTDPSGVIRFRTFSKALWLAGLRVGYALAAPDLIAAFNKVRNHFGMAACRRPARWPRWPMQDWLARVQSPTDRRRAGPDRRDRARERADPLPSATNFVTIDCGGTAPSPGPCWPGSSRAGIFVRMPFTAAAGPLHPRFMWAPEAALDAFAEALPKALTEARKA
jgi:histidinol-phosphate aminotransferase